MWALWSMYKSRAIKLHKIFHGREIEGSIIEKRFEQFTTDLVWDC